MLRLLFAGTPEAAVPSLRAFAADPRFEVAAVLTRPDAPTGRGRRLTSSPVKAAALELGLLVIDAKPRDPGFLDTLAGLKVDIAAIIAYGNILPDAVIEAVPMGWYNLHFSNLPHWRGAAPVQRAIWAGDAVTGADVFRLTAGAGVDEGDIVASMSVELTGRETSGDLLERLAVEGAPMYVEALAAVGEGTAVFTPQSGDPGEYAAKITVEDACLRFDAGQSAEALDRQIRACTPNPGAWAQLRDGEAAEPTTLHILSARPADSVDGSLAPNVPTDLAPGQLVIGKRNVWVGTATVPLELLEVKAQGKKAMRAPDWARGARLTPAAHLG